MNAAIEDEEPIDGFTVEMDGGLVALTLSNRYGHTDRYLIEPEDARRIGIGLVKLSRAADRGDGSPTS